ncbi:hypothetical protein, partial [Falsiroseomonas sp.]|uniref:hypothetical protein n=1 Tax=Falsiroseomonas sp. TaxID=2870721 RepID=UPI002727A6BF
MTSSVEILLTLEPYGVTGAELWEGQGVRATMSVRDRATGNPVAATGVRMLVRPPKSTVPIKYDGDQLTPAGIGQWVLDTVADAAGAWRIRAECTGPTWAAKEGRITLRTSGVVQPDPPGELLATPEGEVIVTPDGAALTARRVDRLGSLGAPQLDDVLTAVRGGAAGNLTWGGLVAASEGAAEAIVDDRVATGADRMQYVMPSPRSVMRSIRAKASDLLSVKDAGAKGDGKLLTNAGVTASAGSAAFTITGFTFTAADVGKMITIGGAGVATDGNPTAALATTITGFVSATQITCADAASASLSASAQQVFYATDDSAAINAWLDDLREYTGAFASTLGPSVAGFMPPGLYGVDSSINGTTFSGMRILAFGVTLYGRTDGKPLWDGLGIWRYQVYGLGIYGCPAKPPNIGFQFGRAIFGSGASGRSLLHQMRVAGYFTQAAMVNNGCETTGQEFLDISNQFPGAWGFAYDGTNFFDLKSDFTTFNQPVGAAISLTDGYFKCCRFTASGSGTWAFYMAGAVSLSFDECYWTSAAGCFWLDMTVARTQGLKIIGGSMEGQPAFDFFINGAGATELRGVDIHLYQRTGTAAVFGLASALTVLKFTNANLAVRSLGDGPCRVFGPVDASKVEWTGDVSVTNADDWLKTAKFSGRLMTNQDVTHFGAWLPRIRRVGAAGGQTYNFPEYEQIWSNITTTTIGAVTLNLPIGLGTSGYWIVIHTTG